MKSWIPKKKVLRFALLTALLSIMLYFAGLFMVMGETQKVEDLYRDSESEFSRSARLAALKSLATANKDLIEQLRAFFIQKGDEVKFIEEIERVAKDSGVGFNILSIDAETNPDDSFKEDINVKMRVEGSWSDAIRFIHSLERMPFGVLIQSTNLNVEDDGSWQGLVEFVVFREK